MTVLNLFENFKSCFFSGPVPVLIFSNRADIRQIQTDGKHYKPVVHTQHIRSAISLDIDTQGKVVYWADNINKTLARGYLNNADRVETIITDVNKPEGVAYDWINKKIYWSNTHSKCEFDYRMILWTWNSELCEVFFLSSQ